MSGERLFGNNITPMCRYCGESIQEVGDHILCQKRGIVPAEHACKRFDYDPIKRIPRRPLLMETYKDEDFSIT